MQEGTKRAAIYARLATFPQEPQPNPFAIQIRRCQSYCEHHGYRLSEAHIYQEVFSGTSLQTRPQLTRLREAAKRREFDVLVVVAADRIARNPALVSALVAELDGCGVTVERVREAPPEFVVGQVAIYARVAPKGQRKG
jgi:DNA invertase Pin-like site-specific DNA recombinase